MSASIDSSPRAGRAAVAAADPARKAAPELARIDGLDGLRALSIGLVLVGHAARSPGHPPWLEWARSIGVVGVELFFAISGFLITWLLLRERARQGSVSLKRFWARRALRILPPLTVMFAGYAVAAAAGVFSWSWPSFIGAASFTRNLAIPGADWGKDWFFAHTWSLSMEEQFYAVWPLVFVAFAGRRGLAQGLLATILAAPLVALACEHRLAPVRNLLPFVPYLALGCWLAVRMQARDFLLAQAAWLPRGPGLLALFIAALAVTTLRNEHRMAWLWAPLDPCLTLLTALALLAAAMQPRGALAQVLAAPSLRALGMISYSLYLWQELFFGPEGVYRHPWLWSVWPFNLAAALACATASYWLVERTSARLKSRWASASSAAPASTSARVHKDSPAHYRADTT